MREGTLRHHMKMIHTMAAILTTMQKDVGKLTIDVKLKGTRLTHTAVGVPSHRTSAVQADAVVVSMTLL